LQTIFALYYEIPEHAYRLGKASQPGFASSLRVGYEGNLVEGKTYDVIANASSVIPKHSGGLSFFNVVNPRLRGRPNEWWCIPAGAMLPSGLVFILDKKGDPRHYVLAADWDMHVDAMRAKLQAAQDVAVNLGRLNQSRTGTI
jgi:hypothetical protein